jgi:chemotaxis protein MotB
VPPAVAQILGGTVDDKGQGNAMMKGPGGAQRALKDSPPDNLAELLPSLQRLTKELEAEIKAGKLELRLEARGLVISLRESAFFPSGTDVLDKGSYPTMKTLAALIGSLPNAIQLEGHTDSVPIHNIRFKSNWELSCARGIAVLDTLCEDFHLPYDRFSVVGRADTVPVDTNETPEGRARNRRVDVVIVNSLRINGGEAVQTAVKKSPGVESSTVLPAAPSHTK